MVRPTAERGDPSSPSAAPHLRDAACMRAEQSHPLLQLSPSGPPAGIASPHPCHTCCNRRTPPSSLRGCNTMTKKLLSSSRAEDFNARRTKGDGEKGVDNSHKHQRPKRVLRCYSGARDGRTFCATPEHFRNSASCLEMCKASSEERKSSAWQDR